MKNQYDRAWALEAYLGDPADPASPLSYRSAVDLDEREEYPEEACRRLDEWGLHRYYVPRALGGRLESLEELMWLVRAVARRNLTVAVCHCKTFLGVVNVWVAGAADQQRQVAEAILRGAQAALAYHEQAHGSDLLATTTEAVPDGDGYCITGEKWLVNNATRGQILTVLARTESTGGAQGFSLFLVDKQQIDRGYVHLPRLKTTGIRGADFSGIRFDACRLDASALLGPRGAALETSVRSFQITRALLPALSLGAGDAGLRAVVEFAVPRQLYGSSITALPQVRATLAEALAMLLLCETLAITALRTLHIEPHRARMITAASKYFIPTTVDALLRELADVLGARHYLREGHLDGMFQKLLRDHAVIRIFHGGLFQLLQTVGVFVLASERPRAGLSPSVFRWTDPLPPLEMNQLAAMGGDAVDMRQELTAVIEALQHESSNTAPELARLLCGVAQISAADQLSIREGMRAGAAYTQSPEFRAVCERACVTTAAASAVLSWWHGRADWEPELASGDWIVLAIDRLLASVGDARRLAPKSVRERVFEILLRWHHERRPLSIVQDTSNVEPQTAADSGREP